MGLLCATVGGNTSPLISILKRQLFTKVSRKGVLPFTRRGRSWGVGLLNREGSVSAGGAPGSCKQGKERWWSVVRLMVLKAPSREAGTAGVEPGAESSRPGFVITLPTQALQQGLW